MGNPGVVRRPWRLRRFWPLAREKGLYSRGYVLETKNQPERVKYWGG